jgi:hypothetical protein
VRALSFSLALLAACEGHIGTFDDAALPDDGALHDAATASDGGRDAFVPELDAGTDAGPPPPSGRVVYPRDRRHSPLTEDMVEALREVRERGPDLADDVFAKVGASATASTSFMYCFAGASVDLDGRPLEDTVAHFLEGDADGTSPYRRDSITAVAGWHAGRALEGSPPPLEQEIDAILPGFAVIMYGTNDVGIVTAEQYGQNLLEVADVLLDRGSVPVMTTVMPRDDDAEADARLPLFNTIVRAIAQGRGVPLVDFHRELMMLPDHGLGPDDIHPSTYSGGSCVFTPDGLRAGYTVRNLITIEAFDRLRRTVLDGEAAPDVDAPRMEGDGSPSSPFEIGELPFTDLRSTLFSEHRRIDFYKGCDAPQDESGPELLYRIELDAPATLNALVISRPGVDVDVHLLDESASAEGCIARDHRGFEQAVPAGTYYFSIDSFATSLGELAGEYIFVVWTE